MWLVVNTCLRVKSFWSHSFKKSPMILHGPQYIPFFKIVITFNIIQDQGPRLRYKVLPRQLPMFCNTQPRVITTFLEDNKMECIYWRQPWVDNILAEMASLNKNLRFLDLQAVFNHFLVMEAIAKYNTLVRIHTRCVRAWDVRYWGYCKQFLCSFVIYHVP